MGHITHTPSKHINYTPSTLDGCKLCGNFRADNKSKYLFTIAVYRKGVSKRLAHFGIPFSICVLPSAIFISVVAVLCLGFSCFLGGLVVGWLGGWVVGWLGGARMWHKQIFVFVQNVMVDGLALVLPWPSHFSAPVIL